MANSEQVLSAAICGGLHVDGRWLKPVMRPLTVDQREALRAALKSLRAAEKSLKEARKELLRAKTGWGGKRDRVAEAASQCFNHARWLLGRVHRAVDRQLRLHAAVDRAVDERLAAEGGSIDAKALAELEALIDGEEC